MYFAVAIGPVTGQPFSVAIGPAISHVMGTVTAEAHSCVDIVTKFTDEQYTTINQSTAGRFDPRVFVNCLQII